MTQLQQYEIKELTIQNQTITYRAFQNVPYVRNIIDREYQQLNIFAPESYYQGEGINGYTLHTAPVFMPNSVGGYMPGKLCEPGKKEWSDKEEPNTIFRALQHGYVVVAPAIRGRVLKAEDGTNTGKAPACIIDYKAAVRFLKYHRNELPGDMDKIITNGTSAGGALSSLMGATGNHPDYEEELKKLGAYEATDDVFAASCYCPITNLDHADMAYEWQFAGEYHAEWGGEMDEKLIQTSKEEAKLFIPYLNGLHLTDEKGTLLSLGEDGNGSFKEYCCKKILESAQKVLNQDMDLTDKNWLSIQNGQATAMDFAKYIKDITRMKMAPAFDSLTMTSWENELFGDETHDSGHFTGYSMEHSNAEKSHMATANVIKMMNPMNYIKDTQAITAKYWRIRHGERDRDTSIAISAMLALSLQMHGMKVDYHLPWDIPHAGDYDIEELFAWVDSIAK